VRIAHAHLRNALRYTLLIPSHEPQIRQFCLWAIGMALLTLRKIANTPRFSGGAQVKISRRSVKLVIVASRLSVRSDAMLKALFALAGVGLPSGSGKGGGASIASASAAQR
jgi:farnesyl-diphosphate farnesyltransferase